MEYEINSGTWKIKCPDAGCNQNLQNRLPWEKLKRFKDLEIQTLVNEELYAKYSKSRKKYKVALANDQFWCPSPDCNAICQIEISEDSGPELIKVTCDECKTEFCSKCSQDWHPDLDCHEVFNQTYNRYRFHHAVKPCPKCYRPIEKNYGCRVVECMICKCSFCWTCLDVIVSIQYSTHSN